MEVQRRPVWLSFTGMGCQWENMGKHMMSIKPFRESVRESSDYLQQFGINIYDEMERGLTDLENRPSLALLGIVVIEASMR